MSLKFILVDLVDFVIIEDMLDWLVDLCVDFVKKHCKEPVPTSTISLPKSCMNMYESLLDEFKILEVVVRRGSATEATGVKENTGMGAPTGDDRKIWLQCLFVVALVWTIGAMMEE